MPDQLLVDAAVMLVAPEVGTSLALNHLTNTLLRQLYARESNDLQEGDGNDHLESIANSLKTGDGGTGLAQIVLEKDTGLHELNLTIESEEKLERWKYRDYSLTG